MKKLTIGWHGDAYWSGLLWYTRPQTIKRQKCTGSGKTPAEAREDLRKQMLAVLYPPNTEMD